MFFFRFSKIWQKWISHRKYWPFLNTFASLTNSKFSPEVNIELNCHLVRSMNGIIRLQRETKASVSHNKCFSSFQLGDCTTMFFQFFLLVYAVQNGIGFSNEPVG
ncbi:Uncharacterised protein [Klebsiella quasipneumoniae]|nr:Uncharacterised protein [Klebsiella quasipneumoniae]CAH1465971.1 Uncharacterised protein [Klebsiella quasipneumoniae]SXD92289.1 Uncharacterised protein [Klebsiella variicola]SXF29022.1 Uncharacterised protein [Klebsiella variicola]VGJ38232.1 Uncharacterised protein [Klebsiella quasipneumoniae]